MAFLFTQRLLRCCCATFAVAQRVAACKDINLLQVFHNILFRRKAKVIACPHRVFIDDVKVTLGVWLTADLVPGGGGEKECPPVLRLRV